MRTLAVASVLLAGCVSIPIPPGGENAGSWGDLVVKVEFRPNLKQVWSRVTTAVGGGKEVIK